MQQLNCQQDTSEMQYLRDDCRIDAWTSPQSFCSPSDEEDGGG
jgi:hypothetical protein